MQGESSSEVFLSYIKCWGKVKHRTEDTISFPFPGLSRDQWYLLCDPLGGRGGWGFRREGTMDACGNSCWCRAEANAELESSYPSIRTT